MPLPVKQGEVMWVCGVSLAFGVNGRFGVCVCVFFSFLLLVNCGWR